MLERKNMETNLPHRWLQKLVILGTPLAIGIVELWHPKFSSELLDLPPQQVLDTISSMISAGSWLTIHLLQLPLFGLLAMSVWTYTLYQWTVPENFPDNLLSNQEK
ncbi:MAG: hypothetical protein KI793_09720 [Rivularia sp. (in: Bacteria)]|nr:hypothetical protein [Rivularia sp. MS3]